jgi:hypothetical protein
MDLSLGFKTSQDVEIWKGRTVCIDLKYRDWRAGKRLEIYTR